jgi:hypothetical protein
VTAPAHRDHVRTEPPGFAENSIDRRFVDDNRLGVGPSAGKRPPCVFRRIVSSAVERREKKRPLMRAAHLSRGNRPNSSAVGPWAVGDGGKRRASLCRTVNRRKDPKLGPFAHVIFLPQTSSRRRCW